MLHLRLIVPPDLTVAVVDRLRDAPEVTNLWHLPGAASKPAGDLVSCDVAKEQGSRILEELRSMGVDRRGSIAVESVDASVSLVAAEAVRAAVGSPADAVVWEEVEGKVAESAVLSVSFLMLIAFATMIGAVGILTDSIVLIIGAMVVGPEYGPLAGICVALVERRPHLAWRSFQALLVGLPSCVIAAAVLTRTLMAVNIAPDTFSATERELTLFIAEPNWYSVIVAVLAGAVGMIAVVSAKSGALIGVLISVTTIPAAANVGVGFAYGAWTDAGRAAAQLGINLVCIIASGLVVLIIVTKTSHRHEASPAAPSN